MLANLIDLNTDPSSISCIAGWSATEPAILAAAAANVLRAVNTIAAGLGLDDEDDEHVAESSAA